MALSIEELDSYTLITMAPHMDKHLAPELLSVFDDLLLRGGKKVVIDFTDTLDIDSSGIGAMVYLFKRLHRKGLALELTGLHQLPLKKIKSLHLDSVIRIRTSAFEKSDSIL